MALYKNSRTYRAFDAENGCFFNKTFTFSYEIDEKYNKSEYFWKKLYHSFSSRLSIIMWDWYLISNYY